MNGHEKRKEAKKTAIKKCASELFEKHGFNKVTLGEIAEKANVSRVTLYKYFVDKENLRLEILKDVVNQTIDQIENIINLDITFQSKFKKIIQLKMDIVLTTDAQFIGSSVTESGEIGGIVKPELAQRIGTMIKKFVQQGIREGAINASLDEKTIFNYFRLIRSGFKSLQEANDPLIFDREGMEKLVTLSMGGLRIGLDDDPQK